MNLLAFRILCFDWLFLHGLFWQFPLPLFEYFTLSLFSFMLTVLLLPSCILLFSSPTRLPSFLPLKVVVTFTPFCICCPLCFRSPQRCFEIPVFQPVTSFPGPYTKSRKDRCLPRCYRMILCCSQCGQKPAPAWGGPDEISFLGNLAPGICQAVIYINMSVWLSSPNNMSTTAYRRIVC